MPQLKNAKKALKQSFKRQARNKQVTDNVRFLMKSTRKAAAESKDAAEEKLKHAIKAIDKAVQKGIIKKNAGARKKSRLTKTIRSAAKAAKK